MLELLIDAIEANGGDRIGGLMHLAKNLVLVYLYKK